MARRASRRGSFARGSARALQGGASSHWSSLGLAVYLEGVVAEAPAIRAEEAMLGRAQRVSMTDMELPQREVAAWNVHDYGQALALAHRDTERARADPH